MTFGERVKTERERKGWSQTELAEKIHVSRQSVSKWETGKSLPSIEVLIDLSDLFGITIDEMLRSDRELKEKVIQDSRQLAYPKWKVFFDSVFLIGVLLLAAKLIAFAINYFAGTDLLQMDGLPRLLANFGPLALMLIGGVGSDSLKDKYR
ncbi:helix-turn-helix domain-containing protein [Planococcus beigongshangi]|uniref:helix-turn-helix domain-containing protein n=1 Tax=Planococcus beigongshangi TaxID=2782536 RepID=UPI00193AF4B1|nr:helix-turn-helix transcriptional regulator [Planococcus beigongshangi]